MDAAICWSSRSSSTGAVIGMLAIYLAVYVVLLGAVLNSQLDRTRLGATDAA